MLFGHQITNYEAHKILIDFLRPFSQFGNRRGYSFYLHHNIVMVVFLPPRLHFHFERQEFRILNHLSRRSGFLMEYIQNLLAVQRFLI